MPFQKSVAGSKGTGGKKKTPKADVGPVSTEKEKVPAPTADSGKGTTKKASTGKRVLVVEDERPLAHALEMKLHNDGFAVTVVTNGTDALKELKDNKYDIALLDLIMPFVDGFTVLEELKAQKIKIPVIVLSNLGQDEDRAKAKSLGAVDYYVKSNTPIADIIKRVKTIV